MVDDGDQAGRDVSGTGQRVVVARDVRRTFDAATAPVRALRGVDLVVERGELVALTGPSGCGKSTLLNVLAGLERADAGHVEIAGVELSDRSDDACARFRRTHVGIVFQFFNLIEGMSALDNVALAALIAGVSRRAAHERARDLLDLLGLLDKAATPPAALSGGLRQRLAIARALANRPAVLFADEPTGALDSDGGAEVLALFRRLNAEGQTILMVTHDPAVAAGAHRIVHMLDGRIVDGAPGVPAAPGAGPASGGDT